MKPETVGRVLGIGLRVAGRVAGQRLSAASQGCTSTPVASAPAADLGARGQNVKKVSGGLAKGVGGFLRPFGRVGGILWLEVTGVFFFIFVPVFVWRGMWPARASILHGPDHLKFLVYTGLALVFLYLSVSSFWRAARK
jgi:hypothetical protein